MAQLQPPLSQVNNGSGETDLPFAGEVRVFRIPCGGIFKLEDACDESAFAIQQALINKRARTSWIKAVVVEGLVGGGISVAEANGLFKGHVEDPGAWTEANVLAAVVLTAALTGPSNDADEAGNVAGAETRQSD